MENHRIYSFRETRRGDYIHYFTAHQSNEMNDINHFPPHSHSHTHTHAEYFFSFPHNALIGWLFFCEIFFLVFIHTKRIFCFFRHFCEMCHSKVSHTQADDSSFTTLCPSLTLPLSHPPPPPPSSTFTSEIACTSWIIFVICLTTTKTYVCDKKFIMKCLGEREREWEEEEHTRERQSPQKPPIYTSHNAYALIKMIWHYANMCDIHSWQTKTCTHTHGEASGAKNRDYLCWTFNFI